MGKSDGKDKIFRLLQMYERFNKGQEVNKNNIAESYDVNERTIRRDIEELNKYFTNNDGIDNVRQIVKDESTNTYKMINKAGFKFSDKDIYVLSKIILESRAFAKKDMERVINILISQCEDNKTLQKIISNEKFNYVPPRHNKSIIDVIWEISKSIQNRNVVEAKYTRQDGVTKSYKLNPLGLVFSEYYFYLIAKFDGNEKNNSIVFRVDRFINYNISNNTFIMEERNRFEESEFHKRIQFMYTGELINIKFKFWGDSLEAILDRLPTAQILKYDEKDNKPIIKAQVYGEGVKRWMLSQKEFLEVLEPESYRNDIKETIGRMYKLYNS